MPDTAAALQHRALECERKAGFTKDEGARERFLALAQTWREMALDYEELEKKARARRSQQITGAQAAEPRS